MYSVTAACGHQVKVKCSERNSFNIKKCTAKCNEMLQCGHPCRGTCGACKQVSHVLYLLYRRKICYSILIAVVFLCSIMKSNLLLLLIRIRTRFKAENFRVFSILLLSLLRMNPSNVVDHREIFYPIKVYYY